MATKVGGLVEACSTRMTKTGAWRTFVPVFDHGHCIVCSLCEIYCPEGCIHQVDSGDEETLKKYGYSPKQIEALPRFRRIFVPDLNYCKGCSVCANECPHMAITMVLEDK